MAIDLLNGELISGSVNLIKYHEDSKKVSKVSVSLSADWLQFGQLTNFHLGWASRGLPAEFKLIADLISKVILGLSKNKEDNSKIEKEVQKEIIDLCSSFPIYSS